MTMTSAAEAPVTDAPAAPRPCARCGAHLRRTNDGDLCDPCRTTIASCLPFMPQPQPEQAPAGADVLKLAAAVMLLHDALHPGEKLDLRRELARYGVELDHCTAWQVVAKLRRRHGLVCRGESRSSGYRLEEWQVRRVRRRLVPSFVPQPASSGHNPAQLRLCGDHGEPVSSLETALRGSL